MYDRFIVAVDGSSGSRRALEHAASLSEKCGGTLLIVHVVDVNPKLTEMAYEVMMEEGKKLLLKSQARARAIGAKTRVKLLVGDPARQIVRMAARNDAVVMGTRGLGPLKGLLLGSVSSKVAQTAKCTVILVR